MVTRRWKSEWNASSCDNATHTHVIAAHLNAHKIWCDGTTHTHILPFHSKPSCRFVLKWDHFWTDNDSNALQSKIHCDHVVCSLAFRHVTEMKMEVVLSATVAYWPLQPDAVVAMSTRVLCASVHLANKPNRKKEKINKRIQTTNKRRQSQNDTIHAQ